MEFMGELVNQKLDHSVTGPKKGMPLSVYVSKLHDIVSTVVTEEAEETTDRLSKKVGEEKRRGSSSQVEVSRSENEADGKEASR